MWIISSTPPIFQPAVQSGWHPDRPQPAFAGLEDFKRELDRAVAQADDPILRASTARARAIVGMPSTPFSNVMPRPLTSGPAITSAK